MSKIATISLRKCPSCQINLKTVCFPGSVELMTVCGTCEGVWLTSAQDKKIHLLANAKKFICADCGLERSASDRCPRCKSAHRARHTEDKKYRKYLRKRNFESYADDIPGLKGILLRFIDRSKTRIKDDQDWDFDL